jgi:Ca2+-transporting ATPase
MVLGTELGILQRILDTIELTRNQWLVCIGVASSLLVVEELTKFILRRQQT